MSKSILINNISVLMRRLWAIQFLRFLVVGGLNTIFFFAVFALLISVGLHYVFSALLATICSILFNFKTTGTIVFKNRNNRLILHFLGIYFLNYLITIGLLKLFDLAGVDSLVAMAIIVLPTAFVSFLLMRKYVFQTL